MNKRNIGIIGSSDSGVSEVFAALLRVSQPPKPPKRYSAVVADTVDYGAEMEVKPPYNASKRTKLFKG